jgi:alpha-D-ribose 1-methylphosphonate 5-triphosphate synthase subunit PhnH
MDRFRDIAFSLIYDSQKIFRLILDCMARPGKINQLPKLDLKVPAGADAHILGILRTLLDQRVSFSVTADNPAIREAIQDYLVINTGSSPRDVKEADFVYSVDGYTHGQVLNMKRGRLEFPEEGGAIVYNVKQIIPPERNLQEQESSSTIRLRLRGPGIQGEQRIALDGWRLEDEILDLVRTREFFPLGVEAFFVDEAGKVICLPRTTKIEIQS